MTLDYQGVNRSGDKVRPAVTMTNLSCEQETAQGLLPSATEFRFTSTEHPKCFNSSHAEFNLGLVNAGGSAMRLETLSRELITIYKCDCS